MVAKDRCITAASAIAIAMAVAPLGATAKGVATPAAGHATSPANDPTAAAQTPPVADAGQDSAAANQSPPVADASDDVVVTARRRSESLQSVPIAMTALSPDTLRQAGAVNLNDLRGLVPNLTVLPTAGGSNGAAVYIRGMGQDGSTIFDEPGVAIYVDGVYLARPIGSLFDLIGIERIEVLRGPQGTLYGRNSTSGAIKVVTRRPSTDALSMEGDFTLGSFNRVDLRANVNVPVTDTLAFNVAASSLNNDGYYHNSLTGERFNRKDTQTARASLLWNNGGPFTAYVAADYQRDRSGLQVPTEMLGKTEPLRSQPFYGDFYEARPNLPGVNRYDGGGGSLELSYDFGGATLQSITAYRGFDYRINLDFSGTPDGLDLLRRARQDQISEELQLSGDIGSRFNYVLGAFAFQEIASETIAFEYSGSPLFTYSSRQRATSFAGFGQANYKLIDWLTITAGGRYSYDRKRVDRRQPFVTSGTADWNKFTPKLGIDAQVTPTLLLYGSWSKGYKAGVFQPFPPLETANVALPPEDTRALEAGFKSSFLDRRATLNVALYSNKYDNLQLGVVSSSGAVGIVSADLKAEGIEVEASVRPLEGLLLYSNFALQRTRFTRLPPPGDGLPVAGDRQKLVSPFSGRGGVDYSFSLLGADKLTLGTAITWEKRNAQQYPNALFPSRTYQLWDGRIGYARDGSRWGIEAQVKNITAVRWWNYSSQLGYVYERYYQPRRTFYVRLKYKL